MKKMILNFSVVFGCMIACSLSFAAGDADLGKPKTAMCSGCHGSDGNSAVASFPKLAGQGEKYLTKQLKDVMNVFKKINVNYIYKPTKRLYSITNQNVPKNK